MLADKCKPLDVHTPFTYWVITKYFWDYSFMLLYFNEPIGYIMSIANGKDYYIWQIGILTDFRKKGLSDILIESTIKVAKNQNYKEVFVSISNENKDSYYLFNNYASK